MVDCCDTWSRRSMVETIMLCFETLWSRQCCGRDLCLVRLASRLTVRVRLGSGSGPEELCSLRPKVYDSIAEQFRDDICMPLRYVVFQTCLTSDRCLLPPLDPLAETSTHPPHNRLRLSKPKQAHIFIPPLISSSLISIQSNTRLD